MYVVAFDTRRISLVSSCFDCLACDTKSRRRVKKSTIKQGNLVRIHEISRELLLAGYIK